MMHLTKHHFSADYFTNLQILFQFAKINCYILFKFVKKKTIYNETT